MRTLLFLSLTCLPLVAQGAGVTFTVRSAQSGKWSDPATWTPKRVPKVGDFVQVRPGHAVVYDVASEEAIRLLHVSGSLTFSRERSTRLDVGLLKVQPGEEATEDGFLCDYCPVDPTMPPPALEIGTSEQPIPEKVTATIRLVHFKGSDPESLPAILVCRARWDIHGAPLSRTWVKLGANVEKGGTKVTLAETVAGWKVGDRILVTASKSANATHHYRETLRNSQGYVQTEERLVTRIDGTTMELNKALDYAHLGEGETQSEVANLSRNVVVESAAPDGQRGHTMYHRNATGGISYAEFRHLGKEGVLGKYPIHFHLVGDTMRGSGVVGASVWDSHNRWITIHGTDYLLVKDCVGYRSVGHGYFLEDGTEQYNVLDRNLAVQAHEGKPLPKQVLPFDQNEGAGFWWANGRNTFTRNVACENDRYGFFYEIAARGDFNTVQRLRNPDGKMVEKDLRTIPFYRFEENEVHSQRFYGFKFGEHNAGIHGDKQHPFIARRLLAWDTHYLMRPNVQYFLLDGFRGISGTYAIYQADYDHHVYRKIALSRISNRAIGFAGRADGHGRGGVQEGPFTFDNVTFDNLQTKGHPLVCMNAASTRPGEPAHFRNLKVLGKASPGGFVNVQGGESGREAMLKSAPAYYFHDYPTNGETLKVLGTRFPDLLKEADYGEVGGVTGPQVRGMKVKDVPFPMLLEPVDDLPPATLITGVRKMEGKWLVQGITHDNEEVESVAVNDTAATITSRQAGVATWEATLTPAKDGTLVAMAKDRAGNAEQTKHSHKGK